MATNDSTKTTKPAAKSTTAKSTRKPAARKPAARKTAAKPAAAKRTTTRTTARKTTARPAATRKTTDAKAATARRSANRQSNAAVREAQSAATHAEKAADSTVDVVGVYAEKAVLIPVGAALLARDSLTATATDVRDYVQKTSVDKELKRFERRGTTARRTVEREVKRARTKAERELRTRRRKVERVATPVRSFRADLDKSAATLRDDVTALTKDVAVQTTRVTSSAQKAATGVVERVAALA